MPKLSEVTAQPPAPMRLSHVTASAAPDRDSGLSLSDLITGGAKKTKAKTRTQELVERGLIPKSWQIPVESAEQGLRSVRQGVSLGFADEFQGALAGAGAFLRGDDFGDAYRAERDRERALARQFEEDYPVASVSGNIGGGLLTGGAPVRAAAAAPNLVRRIAGSSGAGATLGGVAGFGSGEGNISSQLSSAGTGAAIGAAVAPVLPLVGAAAQGTRRIFQRQPVTTVATVPATMSRGEPAVAVPAPAAPVTPQARAAGNISIPVTARDRAIESVAETMRRSGRTPEQIEQQLAREGAKPEILADFLGEAGPRQLYTARTLGGPRAQTALERVAARQEGTGSRVSEDIQAATAPRGQSLEQLDKSIANRRTNANVLYREAFKHGAVNDPQVMQLLNNPEVARIIGPASAREARVAALGGGKYEPLFREVEPGSFQMTRTPTVEDLHLLKTSIDDDIKQAFTAGEGRLGGALRQFKEQIVGALEAEVPAYRKARETYKGDFEIEEAIQNGRTDILRKPVDELRRDFAAMSRTEQDAYRSGAIDTILQQRVDRRVQSSDFARQLWAVPDLRNRLSLLVRNPSELARLASQFDREQVMSRTNRSVFGGSPTAMRETDIASEVAAVIPDLATGNVRGQLVTQVGRLIQKAGGLTEAVADDIADLLTTEGPENIRAVLQTLRNRDQTRVMQALNRARAGRAAAITSSQQGAAQ